jgi:hypothetical protein
MSHPLIHINDVETGAIVEREMTDVEHDYLLAIQAENVANAKKAQDAASARVSALSKLAELGLTDEEIAALIGA